MPSDTVGTLLLNIGDLRACCAHASSISGLGEGTPVYCTITTPDGVERDVQLSAKPETLPGGVSILRIEGSLK